MTGKPTEKKGVSFEPVEITQSNDRRENNIVK
jgi:hypothetical protein